ncbi:MAG: hypothetical protein ACREB5_01125, partial [Sphingomonadaceae bacterium]
MNGREFKAAVQEAVLALPPAPVGFSFAAVATRTGLAKADETRLRRWLTNAEKRGLLVRIGRGLYAASDRFSVEGAVGVGAQLSVDIKQAFEQAGGVLSLPQLLAEVGREDTTLVRRVLTESPLYEAGAPISGFRRTWRLIDAERLKLPVPGRLLVFDVQMAAGGPRTDLPHLLDYRRRQIAAGLLEARQLSRSTVADIVTPPSIANRLDAALNLGEAHFYTEAGNRLAVREWWRKAKQERGRVAALEEAWSRLEDADAAFMNALDVAFWTALGRSLSFDPALLSRGAVARLTPSLSP